MENKRKTNIDELRAKMQIAQEVLGSTLAGKSWVLKHIMGFSGEEVKHIIKDAAK